MRYIQTLKSKVILSIIAGVILAIYFAYSKVVCYDCTPASYKASQNVVLVAGFVIGFISSLLLLYLINFINFHGWKNSYRLNRFKIILFLVLFTLSIFPVLNFNSGNSHIGLPLSFLVGWQRDLPSFPLYFLYLFIDRGEFHINFYFLKLLADLAIIYTVAVLISLKLKRY